MELMDDSEDEEEEGAKPKSGPSTPARQVSVHITAFISSQININEPYVCIKLDWTRYRSYLTVQCAQIIPFLSFQIKISKLSSCFT